VAVGSKQRLEAVLRGHICMKDMCIIKQTSSLASGSLSQLSYPWMHVSVVLCSDARRLEDTFRSRTLRRL
jgi:hypothetical protein